MSRGTRGSRRRGCAFASRIRVLELDIEDHGKGTHLSAPRRGLGIVTMRERAALVGGTIEFTRPREGGTLVRVSRAAAARRGSGRACLTASRFCSPTITASSAAAFVACSKTTPRITVVGEASDGSEAVELACRLRPRVVVMDCAMPRTIGLEATRQILAEAPDTRSADAQHAFRRNARPPGARGGRARLHPQERDRSRPRGRRQARRGRRDGRSIRRSTRPGTLKGERNHGLTARELEVLQLICDGLSNREIAAKLDLSVNTVAVHRANIMNTLGVHKTAELVVYAHAARPGHRADEPARVPASRRPARRGGHGGVGRTPSPRRRSRRISAGRRHRRGSGLQFQHQQRRDSAASSCPRRWARGARFSTTTPTAGRTSCSSTAWTGPAQARQRSTLGLYPKQPQRHVFGRDPQRRPRRRAVRHGRRGRGFQQRRVSRSARSPASGRTGCSAIPARARSST